MVVGRIVVAAVAVRKVVVAAVAVRKVVVVGPTGLAAEDKVAVAAADHKLVVSEAVHIGLVAVPGTETEESPTVDMEKTFDQEVVGQVDCTLTVLEDMVRMFRKQLEWEVGSKATEVVLEIQVAEESEAGLVVVVLEDMGQPDLAVADRRYNLWTSCWREACVAVEGMWLRA
jgi:hypothetical protein